MVSLVSGLREFFREPVTLETANEEIRRALETGAEVSASCPVPGVWRTGNPYLKLLQIAGVGFLRPTRTCCSARAGKTLEKLAAEGVYLTSEEFRGKKQVVRGGQSFRASPKDFRLDDADGGLILTQSSGSRNQAHRYAVSLNRMAMLSLSTCIFFSAHDLLRYSHAIYDAILPTSGGIRDSLTFAKFGIKADRWFARRVPMNSWPEAMFHQLMTWAIVLATKTLVPRPAT